MAIAGFNATYYVQQYPDVLLAISQGTFKSAEEHFTKFGAKEGRNPNAFFDSKYYLAQNPDVLQAVAAGTFASAYDHYIKNGGAEGRVPSAALATFDGAKYLAANDDVKTAGFTEKTAVSHYVLYGAAEGRSGTSSSTGQTVTLTTGQDSITGSDAADIIRGVAGLAVGAQDQTTLNSSDIIDGGKGEDTLAISLTGSYGGSATIKNVETLQLGTNITTATAINGVTFDYNVNAGSYEVTGVNTIVADQITRDNGREILTIANITPTAQGGAIPTVAWKNEAGSLAGNVSLGYRQASVAGTSDTQKIVLSNVSGGVLSVGAGIETLSIESSGAATGRNTLRSLDGRDTTAVNPTGVDLVSTGATDNIADNGSLSKVVVTGNVLFGRAASVITDATAPATLLGLTNRDIGSATDRDRGLNNDFSGAADLISVAATVTEIDASASTGGTAMRFTARADGAEVSQTFKGGDGADYIEFEVGNVNATGGKGNDTFAFVNTGFNSTFTVADSIVGGEGSDTIQLGLNGDRTYTVDWTEFNNKSGIDVLDLRGATNTVTLSDAFVAASDAGLTVRTDKIVQTSATDSSNPAGSSQKEDNSVNTINLTKLSAGRAITVEGGSGSDRLVVNEQSLTSSTAIRGGDNVGDNGGTAVAGDYDTITVIDNAVLSRGDLSNVTGIEGIALVKSDGSSSRQFSLEITKTFLSNNTKAADVGSTNILDNVFSIVTANAGNSNALTNGDTVTIDISDLYTGGTIAGGLKSDISTRVIDVSSLIASTATVTFRDASGTVTAAQLGSLVNANGTASATAAAVVGSLANVVVAPVGASYTSTVAGIATFTQAGTANTDTLTMTDAGTFAVPNTVTNIENLVLSSLGNNSVTFAAAGFTSITGGTAIDTVDISNLASTTSVALGAGNDTLILNGGTLTGTLNGGDGNGDTLQWKVATDVKGATISNFEVLDFGGSATNITMTRNQFANFGTFANFTAGTAAQDGVTFSDAGSVTLNATMTTYNLAAGTNTVDATQTANYLITGNTGADTFNFGTTLTTADVVDGGAGTDVINVTGTANLTNVTNIETINFTTSTAAQTLTTGDFNASATGTGTTITAAGSTVAVTIDASSIATDTTDRLTIIDGQGNDTITVSTTDAARVRETVQLSTGGSDIVVINNAAVAAGDSHVTITNFTSGNGGDKIQTQITAAANSSGGFVEITAAATVVTLGANNGVIEINSALGQIVDPTLTADAQAVENLVALAVGTNTNAGTFTVVTYGNGNAYLYQVTTTAAAADVTTANISQVEYIGVINNITANSLDSGNFA